MIIVYSRSDKLEVDRRLIQGPCIFMPQPNEWLHKFQWHAEEPNNVGRVTPNGRQFDILTIQPDILHYNINEVRTLDDTLLTIKITLIFELIDVYKMLDMTQDPIADFINALCADVVSFVGKMKFSEFLVESNKLNKLDNHPQLMQRAERIGYSIKEVNYYGYHSSDALQNIQDNAIEERTRIRLNTEVEKQKEILIDLKINYEKERFNLQSELTRLKQEFQNKINNENARHVCDVENLKHKFDIKFNQEKQLAKVKIDEVKNSIENSYYKKLNDLDVNLNKYLIELNKSKIATQYELIS